MRQLTPDLAAHLAGGETTLCHCWRVTRRDGVVLGFTDHDADVPLAGLVCQAGSGFLAGAGGEETGLPAAAGEIEGGFSSPLVTAAHLEAGLYDGATVDLFVVNWKNPAQAVLIGRRDIGEVTVEGAHFRTELRPITHRLHQPRGRAYLRSCTADFGGPDCGLSPVTGQHRGEGTVVSVLSETRLLVSGLSGFAGDAFTFGRATFTSGARAGLAAGIAASQLSGGHHLLDLWLPGTADVAPGDRLSLLVGCDKRFETCRDRFANHLNFRGFPHMPGTDFAYSYADRDTAHDGRALVP